MLILIAIVSALLIIVGIFTDDDAIKGGFSGVLILVIVISGFVGAGVGTASTMDEKIALYEQENRAIEEKVELSVSTYLEYEQETLISLTPENAGNFIFLYPELSADTMIQKQIATYQENHKAIVELKLDKINVAKLKWWLYFGK